MQKLIRCLTTVFTLLAGVLLHAQDTTATGTDTTFYHIETRDGTSITGSIVRQNADSVIVQTTSIGVVRILRTDIRSMEVISATSIIKGRFWFENPNATRYVIGPSAIPLRRGEGYYQNLYLFVQHVNYGITDHFSIGAGTEIASLIFSQQAPGVFFVTPKVGYQVGRNMYAGGGLLYAGMPRGKTYGGSTHYGIAYGLFTYGNHNHNATLGVGWMGISEPRYVTLWTYERQREVIPAPVIALSGMYRVARRLSLVSENWMIPVPDSDYNVASGTYEYTYTYRPLFSAGVRFMSEQIAVDVGLINGPDIFEYFKIGIPYIDFVVKFGKRKSGSQDL